METKETVEEQIMFIIGWYNALPSDFLGISEIMHERKQLSTLGATLAVEMGTARKNWKMAEFKLKQLVAQKKLTLTQKMPLSKAENYIKANPFDEDEKATKWEIVFYQKEYIFKAMKEVLSEMNQRISYLKDEQKQDRFYGSED